MKKIITTSLLVTFGILASLSLFAQEEELVVKGNVLYSDQVNALKTPVPVINVLYRYPSLQTTRSQDVVSPN